MEPWVDATVDLEDTEAEGRAEGVTGGTGAGTVGVEGVEEAEDGMVLADSTAERMAGVTREACRGERGVEGATVVRAVCTAGRGEAILGAVRAEWTEGAMTAGVDREATEAPRAAWRAVDLAVRPGECPDTEGWVEFGGAVLMEEEAEGVWAAVAAAQEATVDVAVEGETAAVVAREEESAGGLVEERKASGRDASEGVVARWGREVAEEEPTAGVETTAAEVARVEGVERAVAPGRASTVGGGVEPGEEPTAETVPTERAATAVAGAVGTGRAVMAEESVEREEALWGKVGVETEGATRATVGVEEEVEATMAAGVEVQTEVEDHAEDTAVDHAVATVAREEEVRGGAPAKAAAARDVVEEVADAEGGGVEHGGGPSVVGAQGAECSAERAAEEGRVGFPVGGVGVDRATAGAENEVAPQERGKGVDERGACWEKVETMGGGEASWASRPVDQADTGVVAVPGEAGWEKEAGTVEGLEVEGWEAGTVGTVEVFPAVDVLAEPVEREAVDVAVAVGVACAVGAVGATRVGAEVASREAVGAVVLQEVGVEVAGRAGATETADGEDLAVVEGV